MLEYDENDVVVATYTLAQDRIISQTRGGNTHYYLTDGQRNVRALSNSSATTTDIYRYDAYGELNDTTGTTENPYLYTGQRFDSFSDLYNLRARSYDPNVGRFLSRDTYPIDFNNPIELNRYAYTANNPINMFDPSGYAGFYENSLILSFASAQNTPTVATYGYTVAQMYKFILPLLFIASGLALFADAADNLPKLGPDGEIDWSEYGESPPNNGCLPIPFLKNKNCKKKNDSPNDNSGGFDFLGNITRLGGAGLCIVIGLCTTGDDDDDGDGENGNNEDDEEDVCPYFPTHPDYYRVQLEPHIIENDLEETVPDAIEREFPGIEMCTNNGFYEKTDVNKWFIKGEIDIELENYIIELKGGEPRRGRLIRSLIKKQGSMLNVQGKTVVLYAPDMDWTKPKDRKQLLTDIENMGVIVIGNIDDLLNLIRS